MSINWQQSRVHSLNSSTSKSSYAFQKQTRFRSTSRPLCDTFYNITKGLSSSIGASIGRGNKTTFGDKNGYPSPLQYQIKSSFDNNKNGKGTKIGLGRQSLKYGGIFKKSQTPDPAHYNPKDVRAPSPNSGYTIRPKIKQQQKSFQKNPGPGQYNNMSTISATGIYNLSTISNCMCPKIKPSKIYDPKSHEKTPGPGQYERNKENLNKNGKFFISKYQDSRCRSFSKSTQNKVSRGKIQAPGPGSYNYYSQFGLSTRKC